MNLIEAVVLGASSVIVFLAFGTRLAAALGRMDRSDPNASQLEAMAPSGRVGRAAFIAGLALVMALTQVFWVLYLTRPDTTAIGVGAAAIQFLVTGVVFWSLFRVGPREH
jgi:hypothetical protein